MRTWGPVASVHIKCTCNNGMVPGSLSGTVGMPVAIDRLSVMLYSTQLIRCH